MIEVIAEHSVDLSLLHEGSTILDIGCRGFAFTNAFKEMGCYVCAIDIDALPGDIYYRVAITDKNGRVGVARTNDPQATRVQDGNEIESVTIEEFSKRRNVELWDLIKMDIEGSEYAVIMSLEKAPAKQLSIEFHLHTGIYKVFELNAMENKLKALGYEAVSHNYEARHGAGFNYWDSLFILKG